MREAPEHGNTVGVKAENAHDDGGADQSHKGARELVAQAVRNGDDRERDNADAEGPALGLVELPCQHPDSMKRGAADRGQAQEVGHLMNDDDDRHAGEEAGDDRRGQEIRAIQPRRKRPTRATMTPTITARMPTKST